MVCRSHRSPSSQVYECLLDASSASGFPSAQFSGLQPEYYGITPDHPPLVESDGIQEEEQSTFKYVETCKASGQFLKAIFDFVQRHFHLRPRYPYYFGHSLWSLSNCSHLLRSRFYALAFQGTGWFIKLWLDTIFH